MWEIFAFLRYVINSNSQVDDGIWFFFKIVLRCGKLFLKIFGASVSVRAFIPRNFSLQRVTKFSKKFRPFLQRNIGDLGFRAVFWGRNGEFWKVFVLVFDLFFLWRLGACGGRRKAFGRVWRVWSWAWGNTAPSSSVRDEVFVPKELTAGTVNEGYIWILEISD